MDIATLTTIELKSLAYDQMVLLTQTQHNLRIIEQEIQKRNEVKDES